MYDLILQIIVFGSLGLVIYLMARALPRISDNATAPRGPGFFDRLMAKVPMAEIDQNINSFLAKFLRKLKVVVMKVDNFINHRLGKISKKAGSGNTEKTGDNTQQML